MATIAFFSHLQGWLFRPLDNPRDLRRLWTHYFTGSVRAVVPNMRATLPGITLGLFVLCARLQSSFHAGMIAPNTILLWRNKGSAPVSVVESRHSHTICRHY